MPEAPLELIDGVGLCTECWPLVTGVAASATILGRERSSIAIRACVLRQWCWAAYGSGVGLVCKLRQS